MRCFTSGQNRDLPDGKTLRLARQNHFGSQCATERVYRHFPAKVELKKSHFGKPPLTECVLRHPTCQSELAELSESAIHPEGNAIHGLVEGTISSEMERSVRRVSFAASEETCCKGKQNYYVAYYKECTLLSSAAPSSMGRLACA